MPQPFNNAVMTDGGARLLTRAQAGEISIQFTRLAVGNGMYAPEDKAVENIQKQTALKSLKNTYGLSDVEKYSDHSVKATALITNQNPVTGQTLIEEGYYINEIGLYARPVGDGTDMEAGEVLYSLAVTAGDNGDFMPPYNGYNPAQIIQDYYVTVSNASEVTIAVDNDTVALAEDVIELRGKIETKADQEEMEKLLENKLDKECGENYIPKTDRGSAGGVAALDGSGKVPKEQLSLTAKDIGALPHIRLADKADLNNILTPGVYYVHDGVNAPTDKSNIIVMEGEEGCINQIAFSDAAIFDIHMRVRLGNGTWTEWKNMSEYFLAQTEKGRRGGVATLSASDGKIPESQLPAAADMCVSSLGRGGDTGQPMTFHYTGKPGQPQWVWGCDEGGGANMYVWNPAAFSVAYADTSHGLRAYNEEGISYGESWVMKCKYDMFTDGAFGLYVQHNEGGIMGVRVDRAAMDAQGRDIAATYLPLSGGVMTGDIAWQRNGSGAGATIGADSNKAIKLKPSGSVSNSGGIIVGNLDSFGRKGVCPLVNNEIPLGNPSMLWTQVYAASSAISTSDRNLKQDIKTLTPKHLEFFLKLQPVSFAFIDGSSGRTHIGFISQDVESAMAECGLTNLDFAGFCKDIKTTRKSVTDEDGNQTEIEEQELDEDGNPAYIYSLRYEEFIALNTYAIQTAMARLDSLDERIRNMEGRYA